MLHHILQFVQNNPHVPCEESGIEIKEGTPTPEVLVADVILVGLGDPASSELSEDLKQHLSTWMAMPVCEFACV